MNVRIVKEALVNTFRIPAMVIGVYTILIGYGLLLLAFFDANVAALIFVLTALVGALGYAVKLEYMRLVEREERRKYIDNELC